MAMSWVSEWEEQSKMEDDGSLHRDEPAKSRVSVANPQVALPRAWWNKRRCYGVILHSCS